MRVLSTVAKGYYGSSIACEPMYLEFTDPLRALGHEVDHFDHLATRGRFGLAECGELFVREVREGGYDVVLYQTSGEDKMPREAVREAGRYAPIVAWNSDDDWQWNSYTKHLCPYFAFMVTTYPDIYDANKKDFPNLRLSQWGCYDRYADFGHAKDLDFAFVGKVYGLRQRQCRYLRRKAGLQAYGTGARLVRLGLPWFRGAQRLPWLSGPPLPFDEVNDIWNRSKVSFTPMEASSDPHLLQIKGRTFEMGLSGTLMLCQHSPHLERYYEPGKEFVAFEDLDDCAEKADFYLKHETELARIARAYHDRTRAEHLWQHRFTKLFQDIGL